MNPKIVLWLGILTGAVMIVIAPLVGRWWFRVFDEGQYDQIAFMSAYLLGILFAIFGAVLSARCAIVLVDGSYK